MQPLLLGAHLFDEDDDENHLGAQDIIHIRSFSSLIHHLRQAKNHFVGFITRTEYEDGDYKISHLRCRGKSPPISLSCC